MKYVDKIKNLEDFELTEDDIKIIADETEKTLEKEMREYELKAVQSADEPNMKIISLLEEHDKRRVMGRKIKKLNQAVRFIAMFLICFVLVGVIGVGTSEAFRIKIFNIFKNDAEGSIYLTNNNEIELIGTWKDYWYPTYLPEGFKLMDVEEVENEKFMLYANEIDTSQIRIVVRNETETVISQDTETSVQEEFDVGYYKGLIFTDHDNEKCMAVWNTEHDTIMIMTSGYDNKDEIIKIANNMKYIN